MADDDLLALHAEIAALRRQNAAAIVELRGLLYLALADAPAAKRRRTKAAPRPPRALTDRQRQALLLMAEHKMNPVEAAREMGVSRQVFNRHFAAAKRKTEARGGGDAPSRRSIAAARAYAEGR